jgi:DNA-directed RNA polymerase specialized sigma24 family protein
VVRESDVIRLRLDSLCRFVLVLCGFEQRSTGEAALLLGISKHAVEAAYGSALESLEVIYCQAVLASCGCVAA